MTYQIESDKLTIEAQSKGAELTSIYHKEHNLEYLWQGNPEIWAKQAPVLFPVIGELKNGKFIFEGREYFLKRHGFARDTDFSLVNSEENKLTFRITSNAETLAKYPFHFSFEVEYQVSDDRLLQTFRVYNTSNQTMYFSVGGHPAFNCPLYKNETLSDYFLEFEKPELLKRFFLQEGLVSNHSEVLMDHETQLHLHENIFDQDALIFKNLNSGIARLKSHQTSHGIEVSFQDFPCLGVWAKPGNSGFVCIEPWDGLADKETHNCQLTKKEGIISLSKKNVYEKSFEIKPF